LKNDGVIFGPTYRIAELQANPRLGCEIDLGDIDAPPIRVVWDYERQAGIRSYHGPAAIVELGEVDAPVDYDAALKSFL
jgi:hypothetical protein